VNLEIRVVEVRQEAALREWWDVGHRAASDRAYDVYPAWEHSRVALAEDSPERDLTLLGAFEGDSMSGIAVCELPLLDNTHAAWIDVGVPPEHRGRGVGAALLDRVERLARTSRRTHVIGAAFTPPGTSSAGSRFAAAHGYEVANTEGFKVLDLAEGHSRWRALEAEVAARIGDHRIVEWGTETPDEHAESFARALSTFVSMVPTGDVAVEDGEWTVARLRENERRGGARNRRFCAAAIAADGDLVAFTDLTVSRARTTQGSVGITFVLPGHRGHSLGLAVKLANHRTLMAALPECVFVRTSNADSNEHMNAVNARMGYRQVEDILEVQKVISS
jgi:GNAT superfamily N-acetyltransferase